MTPTTPTASAIARAYWELSDASFGTDADEHVFPVLRHISDRARELDALTASSEGFSDTERQGYSVLVGYLDASGDFMSAEMWGRSDWATESGYTTPVYKHESGGDGDGR